MLDIDGVFAPAGIDPVSSEALGYVVSLLPPEFQGVSFIAQWSSSAGLKLGIIKVHLWFWLEKPLGSAELRVWAKRLAPLIDPAVFNPVQPHYTARPIFDGLPDPVPLRTLFVELDRDTIALVVDPAPTVAMPTLATADDLPAVMHSSGGKKKDGREDWLLKERLRILREDGPSKFSDFAELLWTNFCAACELGPTSASSNTYTARTVAEKCRNDWDKYQRGGFDFQRVPLAVLAPFPDRTVPLDMGLAQLEGLIADYMDKPRHMAIRVTSGAGKTSAACREFVKRFRAAHNEDRKLVLHVYLSTHALKDEIAGALTRLCPELNIVNVIGRRFSNCDRWEIMPALRNLRVSVQRTCCDRTKRDGVKSAVFQSEDLCPYFSTCGFQRQFKPADVYLFTKPYLHASPRDDVSPADYVIIDEAFLSHLIEVREGGLEDLLKGLTSASLEARAALQAIRDALAMGTSPLVALRQLGHDHASLAELAEQLNEIRLSRIRRVRPGMPTSDLVGRITAVGPESTAYLALLALSQEIKHDREDAYSVAYRNSTLYVRLLRDSTVLRLPALILDATADEQLIRAAMPNVEFHTVEVPRKAHVVQVQKRRFSNFSLTKAEGQNQTLALVQESIDRIARRYRRVLLVTFKALTGAFRVPSGWAVAHYGAIRGLDQYKDYDAVVIVGTYLPPVHAVENEAGALAARLPGTRKFTGNYVELHRPFRLREGNAASSIWGHADEIVQRVLEQKREAEMLQAVDRLRLVHALHPKPVFILSNLPLDLTVDELVTLEQLSGREDYLGQLLDHLGGVVPLRAGLLHDRKPDLFPSVKAAEKWAAPYTPKPLIVSIRQTGVKELRAKGVGQKGPSDTRILVREDHPAPRAAIEHQLGELSSYDGPPDRDAAIFVNVPGTTRTVGAKIVQFIDDGWRAPNGWKPAPLPPDLYRVLNPSLIERARATALANHS